MLDTGVHGTIEDLAKAKGIGKTYVSRVLRLTLLAPEMVEAILNGRQHDELQVRRSQRPPLRPGQSLFWWRCVDPISCLFLPSDYA
jgi:hypothetical protein